MKNHHRKILPGLLALCASLSAQIPKWAETGTHKDFPQSRYLLGVGISENKTTAAELARADVAKQIQVKIESELETIEKELSVDNKHELSSEIISQTKSVVSETVAGIEIKKTKKTHGTYYVLAVLNKRNYLSGLVLDMDDISSAVSSYISEADSQIRRGNLKPALDNFTSALDKTSELYAKRSLYTALSGNTYSIKGGITPATIQADIRKIFSSVHIEILGGNNQTAPAGTQLPEPIRVFVYLTDREGIKCALRQFPVTVGYTGGEKIGDFKTNDAGELSVRITVSPGNNAVFRPDFHSFQNRYGDYLQKIEAVVNYTTQSTDKSFGIRITDASGNVDPSLIEMISGLVNNTGAHVDSSSPFQISGTVAVSDERSINSPAGKQFLIEVKLLLSLTDTRKNVQLATIYGKGKGLAVGSREKAIDKAMENISFSKSKFAAFLQAAN